MTNKAPYLIDDTVEILVIADRSGSMGAIKDDAIGGFNNFLKEQQKLDGDANLTLVLFDTEYDVPVKSQDIQKVKPLTEETFVPRGMTALNDAIGRSISELESKKPEKAIICILTDGLENSSREYNNSQVKELVEGAKSRGWEVVYLAANQDAFAEGNLRGISKNINFAATSRGINDAYTSMNATTTAYRTGNSSLSDNEANHESS